MHRGERMAAQPPKGAERDRAMCSARGPSSALAGKRASRERSEFGEKPKSQRRRSAQPPALPSTAAPYVVYFFGPTTIPVHHSVSCANVLCTAHVYVPFGAGGQLRAVSCGSQLLLVIEIRS